MKRPQDLAFLPDGRTLVVACGQGQRDRQYLHHGVFFFDVTKAGSQPEPLSAGTNVGRCLSVSGDGKLLACGASGGKLQLWQLPERRLLKELAGHGEDVDALTLRQTARPSFRQPMATQFACGASATNLDCCERSTASRSRCPSTTPTSERPGGVAVPPPWRSRRTARLSPRRPTVRWSASGTYRNPDSLARSQSTPMLSRRSRLLRTAVRSYRAVSTDNCASPTSARRRSRCTWEVMRTASPASRPP